MFILICRERKILFVYWKIVQVNRSKILCTTWAERSKGRLEKSPPGLGRETDGWFFFNRMWTPLMDVYARVIELSSRSPGMDCTARFSTGAALNAHVLCWRTADSGHPIVALNVVFFFWIFQIPFFNIFLCDLNLDWSFLMAMFVRSGTRLYKFMSLSHFL
jgi:hypothetical protein